MKIDACVTCEGDARVGTLAELQAGPQEPGCALIVREVAEGKRELVTSRCAAKAKHPNPTTPRREDEPPHRGEEA